MNDLMLILRNAQEKKEEQKRKAEKLRKRNQQSKQSHLGGGSVGGEEEDEDDDASVSLASQTSEAKKIQNDIFIFRLIHSLYEDCDGGVDANARGGETKGIGMRLTDVVEALSCCCCSAADELAMEEASTEFIQYLYDLGQKDDIIHFNNPTSYLNKTVDKERSIYPNCSIAEFDGVSRLSMESRFDVLDEMSTVVPGGDSLAWGSTVHSPTSKNSLHAKPTKAGTTGKQVLDPSRPNAKAVLKYGLLRNLTNIPRISQDVMMQSLLKFPQLMALFSTNLTNFRALVHPYTIEGTVTYEQSLMEESTYGTRKGSNMSLFRRGSTML